MEKVGVLVKQLGNIFRHMLPGVLILAGAKVANPKWFESVNWSTSWEGIVVLGIVTVSVGNVAYVLHRLAIHQLIDYVVYRAVKKRWKGYPDFLFYMIHRACAQQISHPQLREHIYLRSSQMILMFIVSETLLFFSFWCEPYSFFDCYQRLIVVMGIVLFTAGVVQFCLLSAIDRRAIEIATTDRAK